jgi:hypothetical protein
MSSVEESPSVESKYVASLDSTHEPTPEPQTPKERLIHPSEFPIEFRDYGNTSKLFQHEKHLHPPKVSLKVELSKEWLMEVKHFSKAIRILLPSMAMPCSLKGTIVEALHNPTVETRIMSEFLEKNLLGNMPLVPTNKFFKSPLGLIFKCCGIVRAVPIKIDENEVPLDFHIYAILKFELFIGHPLDNLFQEKPSQESLNEKLGKTTTATHLDIPMAKHHPNHNPFEEVKFVTPFVSPKLAYETERPHPRLNQSHVSLAIKTLFSIVIKIQR